jgi:hypothetical protein
MTVEIFLNDPSQSTWYHNFATVRDQYTIDNSDQYTRCINSYKPFRKFKIVQSYFLLSGFNLEHWSQIHQIAFRTNFSWLYHYFILTVENGKQETSINTIFESNHYDKMALLYIGKTANYNFFSDNGKRLSKLELWIQCTRINFYRL